MSMNKHTYIGPYVRCYGAKSGEPDNWAQEEIMDATGAERLYYANGEGMADSPALFAPNVSYDGATDFLDEVEDGGEMEIPLKSVNYYNNCFALAFREEIEVLRSYFERIEIVFGVIVSWS